MGIASWPDILVGAALGSAVTILMTIVALWYSKRLAKAGGQLARPNLRSLIGGHEVIGDSTDVLYAVDPSIQPNRVVFLPFLVANTGDATADEVTLEVRLPKASSPPGLSKSPDGFMPGLETKELVVGEFRRSFTHFPYVRSSEAVGTEESLAARKSVGLELAVDATTADGVEVNLTASYSYSTELLFKVDAKDRSWLSTKIYVSVFDGSIHAAVKHWNGRCEEADAERLADSRSTVVRFMGRVAIFRPLVVSRRRMILVVPGFEPDGADGADGVPIAVEDRAATLRVLCDRGRRGRIVMRPVPQDLERLANLLGDSSFGTIRPSPSEDLVLNPSESMPAAESDAVNNPTLVEEETK